MTSARPPGSRLVGALCLVLAAAACLPKASVPPNFYSIDPPAPDPGEPEAASVVLSLANATVAPVYAGRAFVYRVGPHRVEHDPYASFAASPSQLLTAAIRGYLRNAAFVRDVVAPGDGLPAYATIDTYASQLCADLGDGAATAILTVRFRVVAPGAESPPAVRDVFIHTYTQRVPMGQRSAAAAADAWNTALAEIMKAFLADLQPALAPKS